MNRGLYISLQATSAHTSGMQCSDQIRLHLQRSARPLIVVLGPTASGKTDFSIRMAHEIVSLGKQPEIINADSRQLYRYLDVGTAKITKEEMRGVPHHLIDVLDPKEDVTAAWYQKEAMRAIDDIHAQGGIPLLVGGSMLYISAVIDGLSFAPVADSSVRSRLEQEYDADAGETLYRRLQELDPETAASFHPRNRPYLIRALEIIESTGENPSALKQSQSCPYDLLIFGMDALRHRLVKRIDERTSMLLASGWVDEVRSLLNHGYKGDDPGMKSHGYREVIQFIDGSLSETELHEIIAAKTRQYAKRQMTWWKDDERIHWIRPVRMPGDQPGASLRSFLSGSLQ